MTHRIRQSGARLVIDSGSRGSFFFFLIFVVLGLLVWLYRPLLACDHDLGTCTLNANDMPGNPQQVVAIASIDQAVIQTRQHREDGPQSRVVLEVAGRPVPVGADWSGDPGVAESMAEQINAFLNDRDSASLRLIPYKAVHFGSLTFIAVALLMAVGLELMTRKYRSVFDQSQDRYRIESRGWLRRTSTEGRLSAITGTLEKAAGGSSRSRNQLGLLDVDCQFHPFLVPCGPGGRRLRETSARIRQLLALDETRSLNYWDLKPKLSEQVRSIGRTDAQTQELASLQIELETDPFNIELLRQIALRLKRLGRSDEASALLRARHRRLIDQNRYAEANLLAGIVWTMNL